MSFLSVPVPQDGEPEGVAAQVDPSELMRQFIEAAGPDIARKLDAERERERAELGEQAEDAVYLIVRDVRKHWANGDCDGDRSCLGADFSAWAGDASNGELALVLGRAIAMLSDLLPANIEARCAAALARDEQRERSEDPISERAREALSDDADGALVLGPFPAGEGAPSFTVADLGALLRGEVRPS